MSAHGRPEGENRSAQHEGYPASDPITARAVVAQARSEAERKAGPMSSIRKILIVDDSPTERHVLQDMLTKAGYEVLASDNGEDAIAQARSSKPDLILMDVVMPGLNGFQATRAISRDPETRSIPVIMCTSKSQETDKIWGLRQGARDYVVKPVVRDELLAKITSLG
jgi:twitching motility two-component system response regulator PilH